MKKTSLLLAFALSLLLCACGGADSAGNDAKTENGSMPSIWDSGPTAEMDMADGFSPMAQEGQSHYTSAQKFDAANVKLILRADLNVETLDFDAASAGLETLVDSLGGYFENKELYQGGYYSTNTYRSASYVVRVPSEQYDAFLSSVSGTENCHVVRLNEYVDNVGQEYFDAESRLKTQRIKQERLQALLAEATNMEDIIALENALTEVEYEIDQYTTTLNRYDGLIGYATITVSLSQVGRLSDTATEPEGLGTRMARGFKNSVTSFIDGLGDFAVWFSYNFIGVLIFLAAALVGIRFVLKAWKKRRAPIIPPAPPSSEENIK